MMFPKDNRFKIVLIIAIICVILDQITKYLIIENIPPYDGFNIISGLFNIVHVKNHGAAFGFLNDPSTDWQFWFFFGVTVLVLSFIINLIRTSAYNLILFWGFALIVGGAIGNFIDRVRFRYVIDFLDFFIGKWHWPVFNVADMCICIGTFIVAIVYYYETKQEKANA